MEKADVEVVRVSPLAQFVDLLHGVGALASGDLGHQLIAVARNALERDAKHGVHVVVRLRGLKKANAPVVSVADQLCKVRLSQFALHLPAEGTGAKSKARDFYAGIAERYHVCGRLACRLQPQTPGARQRRCCQPRFQEITSGKVSHWLTSTFSHLTTGQAGKNEKCEGYRTGVLPVCFHRSRGETPEPQIRLSHHYRALRLTFRLAAC